MQAIRCSCPLVVLLLVSCGGAAPRESEPSQEETAIRNVVVVLADTLRAPNLGLYGHWRDTSPHLASLASEGFLFEDVTAQAPCTYPSVNSILTGRDGTHFWVQEGRRIGIPEETPTLAGILAGEGWTTVAVSASPVVRRTPSRVNDHGGFGQGFDLFDETCLWGTATCVNRRAFHYLEALREPFFLYLHYMDPHDPYRPPERKFSSASYEGKKWVASGNPNPIQDLLYGDGGAPFDVTEADLEYFQASYDDEIAFFDQRLEELVSELRRRDLLERSLVIVISDHGEEFLEHRHIKHCHTLYRNEVHTPMVLRIPGREGNRRIPELAQNLDLVPTILDYLGLPVEVPLDGRSLRPLIEGGAPIHDHVFAAYGSLRAVVTQRHKLIVNLETGEVELYDRVSDPDETRDVAGRHPEEVRAMRRALARWIRETERMASEDEALRQGQEAAERLRALGYVK